MLFALYGVCNTKGVGFIIIIIYCNKALHVLQKNLPIMNSVQQLIISGPCTNKTNHF